MNKKPLANEVNGVETKTLIAEFAPSGYDKLDVLSKLERLARARDAKDAHKKAHKAVYDTQKQFTDEIKELESQVYAQLAALAESADSEAELDALAESLPDGLGIAPRYEMQVSLNIKEELALEAFESDKSDPIARAKDVAKYRNMLEDRTLLRWCLSDIGSRKYLTVNKRLFELDAKALSDKAYYIADPLFAPPVTIVETVLPTLSKKLDSEAIKAALLDTANDDALDNVDADDSV